MSGYPSLLVMPLKIIGDYREILVDIFFAIIITIGFEGFIHRFFIGDVMSQLNSFDITSLINVFSAPEILIDTLFFFATFFWVISHWVFYHELIDRYPYYNSWKFFVDITLFSIMFVIINISYLADDKAITPLFILLVAIWYFFSCFWHLSDKTLRPVARYLKPHIKRLATYSGLLVLLYDPLSMSQITPWYRYGIMVAMIVAMITWNIHRLSRFIGRDLREYRCDYVRGYPGWYKPYEGGTLLLVKYPMKGKSGAKEKDKITFSTGSHSKEIIEILPENVNHVSTTTLRNEPSADDLMLEIAYKDENGKDITLVLKLSGQVISGVKKAIQELCKRNRKTNVKPGK
jgi:hypothetical protein